MKPTGQILDCSESEYRAISAANYSTLKHAQRSAAHMFAAMAPRDATPAMLLGSLVDAMVFGPDELHLRFVRAPQVDRRTKSGRDEWEAFNAGLTEGCRAIDSDTWEKAERMVSMIRTHRTARALLNGHKYQTPMVWVDPDTGVRCKALLDSVLPGVTITDLKTTTCADARDFARAAASMAYHVQAAFYSDGWRACTGTDLPFTFIVSESVAPHAVAVYRLDDAAIDSGRARYKSALQMFAECTRSGVWPGYADHLQTLELPRWALGGAVTIGVDDHPF
jgi:hypothetical protein